MAFKRASDGKWVETISTPTGRKAFYGDTKAEAQEKARAAVQAQTAGVVDPGRVMLGAYLDGWLETIVKPYNADNTYVSYESVLRLHIKPALGELVLRSLTFAQCQAFITRSAADGTGRRTLELARAVLHVALEHAVKKDHFLRENPADGLELPKADAKEEMAVWTRDQARAFLAAARKDENYALWLLALTTSMRQGEMLGLHWDCVDLDAGVVTVRRNLIEIKGTTKLVEYVKSKSGQRNVVLTPELVVALRMHRNALAARGLITPHVFTSRNRTYLHKTPVRRVMQRLIAEAGVPFIRFHDMRHTSATMMAASGVSLRTLQAHLGHSDASTTQIYTHVVNESRQEAARIIGEALHGKAGAQNE